MFRIMYELENDMLISDVQETIAETLEDAELVAVVGCGQRLSTSEIMITHYDDLFYLVYVDGHRVGCFKIRSL